MFIKIVKLDFEKYAENTTAWHLVLDLSYFDSDKRVSVQALSKEHQQTESFYIENLPQLEHDGMIVIEKD